MKILIAGGTGFIGQALVEYYLKNNNEISILGRNHEKILKIYGNQVSPVIREEFKAKKPDFLNNFDLIINLAGAGIADQRWTESRKKLLIESRIIPTRTIAELCAQLGKNSPPLFNASAVGIYGTQAITNNGLTPRFDEDSPLDFDHPSDFSSTITRLWEKETWVARDQGVRVVNLRFGVVIGKNGGALSRMILPFRFGLGGRMGTGKQPFSWVSSIDLCRAIEFIFNQPKLVGPINIVSPQCVTQYEFAQTLAKILHRPSFTVMPAWWVKLIFGEMGNELLLNGQDVFPKRLMDCGFKFEYSNLESALQSVLQT